MRVLLWVMVCAVPAWGQAPAARPAVSATSESVRLGAEYFVQRAGVAWVYQLAKGRGRVSIVSVADWRVHVSYSLGKLSGSLTWRVKDGAWFERGGGREGDALVLPASMTRGTRWTAPASVERGGRGLAQYEVLALEASVELPNGHTLDNCLAVLETAPDGSEPTTHYFVPNMGKVAVMAPDGWLYRLVEFHPASRGHGE